MDPTGQIESRTDSAAQPAASAQQPAIRGLRRREPLRLHDHFACGRCGYDLLGLPVLSHCPECGASVMTSIVTSEVPYALRMRALASPRRVATGLALLAAGFLLSLTALASPLGVRAIYQLNGLDPRPAPTLQFTVDLLLLTGTLVTLLGTLVVSPRRDRLLREELTSRVALGWWQRLPMLRIGAFMGVLGATAKLLGEPAGLMTASALMPDAWMLVVLAWFLLAGATAERALTRLISVLGRRSRLFLEGAHARQSVDVLILAAGAAVIGRAGTTFMHRADASEWIIIPRAVWLVGGAMLLFSTMYLAANCVWIIRALWRLKSNPIS